MSRKSVFLREKVCGTCKHLLPIEKFSSNKTPANPIRTRSTCRECFASAGKRRREARKAIGICIYCESPRSPESNKCMEHLQRRYKWRSTAAARVKAMLTSAKRGAAMDGTKFTLADEWVRSRLEYGRCELTGLSFDLEHGGRVGRFNPFAPSIDRRISGGDYSPENCRMVLVAINVGMNFWGEETYRKIAKAYFRERRKKSDELSGNILWPEISQLDFIRKHLDG